jgi:hypothetical protein
VHRQLVVLALVRPAPSGSLLPGARCCLTPDAAVRSMPARLLLMCLLLRSSRLTVDGGHQVSAARVAHRRGGRAAVAVSVSVAGGVPTEKSRSSRSRWLALLFGRKQARNLTGAAPAGIREATVRAVARRDVNASVPLYARKRGRWLRRRDARAALSAEAVSLCVEAARAARRRRPHVSTVGSGLSVASAPDCADLREHLDQRPEIVG